MQNALLDGHKLQLQLSMKKGLEADKPGVKAKEKNNTKATKIVVRNVAFEAKSQEVRSVFQPFGQVKSVRVPRKFDGSHRSESHPFLAYSDALSLKSLLTYNRVCFLLVQVVNLAELQILEWKECNAGHDPVSSDKSIPVPSVHCVNSRPSPYSRETGERFYESTTFSWHWQVLETAFSRACLVRALQADAYHLEW